MKDFRAMENFIVGDMVGTVLFLDIKNFLGISEILTPRETYQFIKKVMTPLTTCVSKYKGYVCQIQGDAIMAVFGHDSSSTDHANYAVKCALEQQQIISELNPVLINKYKVPLSARIGICSGPMYACFVRILGKIEYTVLSKTVNIASRLQKINKQYETNILIDESVFGYIKRNIVTRKLDMVDIDGCSELLRVYEILFLRAGCHAEIIRQKEYYEKGLEYYLQGEWDHAITWFSQVAEDKASYLMIERCKKQKSRSPDIDRNAVKG